MFMAVENNKKPKFSVSEKDYVEYLDYILCSFYWANRVGKPLTFEVLLQNSYNLAPKAKNKSDFSTFMSGQTQYSA